MRRQLEPVAVTDALVEVERRRRLEGVDDDARRRRLNRALDEIPIPETLPAYKTVYVDDESNLWVQEYNPPGVDDVTWTVFDASGILLGQLAGHPGFTPHHIGADFMVGLWKDDLDLEHIKVYSLDKCGAARDCG